MRLMYQIKVNLHQMKLMHLPNKTKSAPNETRALGDIQ